MTDHAAARHRRDHEITRAGEVEQAVGIQIAGDAVARTIIGALVMHRGNVPIVGGLDQRAEPALCGLV
jgi:hypothetical protein